jgi:hypothetical protein
MEKTKVRQPLHLKLRKWTTPVHIISGIITILTGYFLSACAGIILFLSFLIFEWWDDYQGSDSLYDFWEWVLGAYITAGIILVLQLAGII